jgi:hypothetical protein
LQVDTSIPHHFPTTGKAPASLWLTPLLLCAAALFFGFQGPEKWVESGGKHGVTGFYFLVIGVPLLSPMLLYFFFKEQKLLKGLVGKPVIEISGAGIIDRRAMAKVLAWADIECVRSAHHHFAAPPALVVVAKTAEAIKWRSKTSANSFLGKSVRQFKLSPVGLQAKPKTLSNVVMAFWNEQKNRSQ